MRFDLLNTVSAFLVKILQRFSEDSVVYHVFIGEDSEEPLEESKQLIEYEQNLQEHNVNEPFSHSDPL